MEKRADHWRGMAAAATGMQLALRGLIESAVDQVWNAPPRAATGGGGVAKSQAHMEARLGFPE